MKSIKIVGVPEHFNLPWIQSIANGTFEKKGIHLQWQDIPEGTGKMCQMLRDGETDMAVILTEGIIKDIIAGNQSKIVQIYVESPLIWGIHVAAKSNYQTIADLENKKIAISRLGSGSQLMAYVNANNQQWNTKHLEFEIVNTIDGAVKSLTNGEADYFMWERFMTKPLVDKGVFRRVGDCPTPWPCFVIAVRTEFLEENKEAVQSVLQGINAATRHFKEQPNIAETLANTYHQKLEDIQEWLALTTWSQKSFTKNEITAIQNKLFDLQIIAKKSNFATLVETM
jgi:ABC-type nitrate/sulfonate/bicarbonate transport system substrate-binding protein